MNMIYTERLILRRFRGEDIADFLDLIHDKQRSQWAVYDGAWPSDDRALTALLGRFCESPNWFCIELAEEKKCIGFVAAHFSADGRECDIGYTLHTAYQRRGYGYEACAAALRELARAQTLVKFTAGTAECNYPSVGLLVKLGFAVHGKHIASFAKDAEGNPIRFIGNSFECDADRWHR